LVELMIEKGAVFNELERDIEKPSNNRRHNEMVESIILNPETDLNVKLYITCIENNKELVKYFIHKGANDWNYVLKWACVHCYLDIVKFMIIKGADAFDQALVYAKMYEDDNWDGADIIWLLKDKIANRNTSSD
jgi:hypothetical protein